VHPSGSIATRRCGTITNGILHSETTGSKRNIASATLPEWSLNILVALMALFGFRQIRRRWHGAIWHQSETLHTGVLGVSFMAASRAVYVSAFSLNR
jgi:hypothetical protein